MPARSRGGRVVGTLLCEKRLVENAGTFDPGLTMRLEMSTAASAAALYRYDFSAPPAPGVGFALLDTDEQQKAMRMRVRFEVAAELCSCVWMLYSQRFHEDSFQYFQTVQMNKNDPSAASGLNVPGNSVGTRFGKCVKMCCDSTHEWRTTRDSYTNCTNSILQQLGSPYSLVP